MKQGISKCDCEPTLKFEIPCSLFDIQLPLRTF